MEKRNLIIVGVAIVIGLFAVYIANSWFTGREVQQERVAQEQGLVRVAVASRALEFGAPIASDTVALENWPAESVPDGAITDLDRILNGRNVAIRPIARGEPILISRISDRAILSANLPDNMRAVTIPVNAVSGVAGFVFPGDVVDIFLTRQIPGDGATSDDQMTTVIIENVQVLAVDRRASENATEPEVGDTATVLVDQFAAQRLTLATEIGKLSLALRNVEDQMMGTTRVATSRDLGGAGFYIADRGNRSPGASSAPVAFVERPAGSQSVAAIPNRPSGPSMLVYRGTEATRQEVMVNGR